MLEEIEIVDHDLTRKEYNYLKAKFNNNEELVAEQKRIRELKIATPPNMLKHMYSEDVPLILWQQ
ncbi:MAG: hypothetical protein ACPGUD_00030 [Parashewanella sp.]